MKYLFADIFLPGSLKGVGLKTTSKIIFDNY